MLFTAPAVWQDRLETWVFGADNGGTTAWRISNGQLTQIWSKLTVGSSPVLVGGLLYVYDPNGGLHIYNPRTGADIATLDCGRGHWNSPIVVDGRIALPEGTANTGRGGAPTAATAVIDIWRLPKK